MTWGDFFSSQLFGVIVGALLTGGFTWLLDHLRYYRERKLHFCTKREETYLLAIDAVLEYSLYEQNGFTKMVPLGIQKLNALQGKMGLYASRTISADYYAIINMIATIRDKEKIRLRIVEFTESIRMELGIQNV